MHGSGAVPLLNVQAIHNGFLVTYRLLYRAEVKVRLPIPMPGDLPGPQERTESRTQLVDRTVYCKGPDEVANVVRQAIAEFAEQVVRHARHEGIDPFGGEGVATIGGLGG